MAVLAAVTVALALTRTGRKLLGRAGRKGLRATLSVTGRLTGGHAATRKITVRLR